ncbi:MAG: VCBS repeat-containing protein [Pseudomonadota bacterium]
MKYLVLAILLLSGAAQADWRAAPVKHTDYPEDIVIEERAPAPGGFPNGLLAERGSGDIRKAWYADPTERYRHGILGDAIEAGMLMVETETGEGLAFTLPVDEVFEDRYPRLADLDGDGSVEVVAIRSSLDLGGSVTVYGLAGGELVQKATTPFIGLSNRWLNVAGIADFDGDGAQEIAYVKTPHIGGTLILYGYRGGDLVQLTDLWGFSNHAIGATEMRLSAVVDLDGDGDLEIALPSADRRALRIMDLSDGRWREIAAVELPGRVDRAIRVEGEGATTSFILGLATGIVVVVSR